MFEWGKKECEEHSMVWVIINHFGKLSASTFDVCCFVCTEKIMSRVFYSHIAIVVGAAVCMWWMKINLLHTKYVFYCLFYLFKNYLYLLYLPSFFYPVCFHWFHFFFFVFWVCVLYFFIRFRWNVCVNAVYGFVSFNAIMLDYGLFSDLPHENL